MRTLALVLLGLLGLASPAFAENLYIGQASAGFANGTSCANQRAISFFNGSGNWGAGPNLISSGDTVYLCGTITTPLTVQGSGTAGNVITISPAPSQKTTIDASGLTGAIFDFTGHQYITVDGIEGDKVAGNTAYRLIFTNVASTTSVNTYGLYDNAGGSHVIIKHVKVVLTGSASPDDNGGGIFITSVGGVGYEVAYCWVTGTSAPNKHAQGITSFTGSGVSTGTSFTSASILHHNYVEYMWHDGIRTDSNASVYNNYLKEIGGSGHSDGIICQSGRYCQMYNNTLENAAELLLDNELSLAQGPVRIYNNVSYNGGFGVDLYSIDTGSWNDLVIANNTFYNGIGSAIRGSNGPITNVVLLNNIFGSNTSPYENISTSASSTYTFASSTAWDYNAYGTTSIGSNIVNFVGTFYTLSQLLALSPARETHGRVGNVAFVSTANGDFHLANGDTVARGHGVNLTATYSYLTVDKDGVARPNEGAWDLGAYQGASSSTRNPKPVPPSSLFVR